MTVNIFEYAARNKLRFTTTRGEVSVEQLWDIPLRAKDDFNLNMIAKVASKAAKEAIEENFVDTKVNTQHTRLLIAFDVVKHVIETKLNDEAVAKKRADNKIEREKILGILAEKQTGKLSELSEQELQARIAALE